jgi:glutamate N-acetyltransferase/amino-acid acetyltransferase
MNVSNSIQVIENPPGGTPAPAGFVFAGVHSGVKRSRLDLGLIHAPHGADVAGVYTRNPVRAACVDRNAALTPGRTHAVVVNAGNANAMTGAEGVRANQDLAEAAAKQLGVMPGAVLTSSTGVIGVPLPVERIAAAMPQLNGGEDAESSTAFEHAILTTDTGTKSARVRVELEDGRFAELYGAAKGSGMIHPDMATTLGFVCTDAEIPAEVLQAMLDAHVVTTFNAITVDGDTSTNDTVLVLASGAGEAAVHDEATRERFAEALFAVLRSLARQVAADGEGASRLLELVVEGAPDDAVAQFVARTIATSPLFKCSVFAGAAGFGRLAAAAGRALLAAGIRTPVPAMSIWAAGVPLVLGGRVLGLDTEATASLERALSEGEVRWTVDLGLGSGRFVAWGCDLSPEYIRINAKYGADGPPPLPRETPDAAARYTARAAG